MLEALQLEPGRRYPSVEQFAEDVRRYLDGRPISARPDTAAYRTRMFLRRHPWVAPVAIASVALTVAAFATLTRHAAQLERERSLATMQSERAQEVQRFLVDLFRSADPYAPADPERGRGITVLEALDVGARTVQSELTDRPGVRAAILDAIAEVYLNLGAVEQARALREDALALQGSVHGPSSAEVRQSLAQLARIHIELGDAERSLELRERRLALARAADPWSPVEVARALIDVSLNLIARSREAEAEPLLREAIAMGTDGQVAAAELSEAHRALADVYRLTDRLDEAEDAARYALARRRDAYGERSIGVALARITLAQALGEMGRTDEAAQHYEDSIRLLDELVGAEHRLSLVALNNLSVLRVAAGDLAVAEELQRRVLASRRAVHAEGHHLIGDSLQNLGTTLARLGRLQEARALHEQAAEIYRDRLEPGNYLRAFPILSLSNIYLTERQYARAETSAREALDILEQALPAGHFITAVGECRLAQALVGAGHQSAAETPFARAVEVLIETRSVPEYRRECLEAASNFYAANGNRARAAALRDALTDGG